MPGFDGTGPMGQGAGTGRRLGPCYNQNVFVNPRFIGGGMIRGRGFGRGMFGRGFRRLYGMGYRRWWLAQEYGDPNRALYGCGPCGEAMYRASIQQNQKNKNNNTSNN